MTYDAEETLPGLNQAGETRATFAAFLADFLIENNLKTGDVLVELFEEYVTERDVYDYTDNELHDMYDAFDPSTDNVASNGLTLTLAENNTLNLTQYTSELWQNTEDKTVTTFESFDDFYQFLKTKNLFHPHAPSAEIDFSALL